METVKEKAAVKAAARKRSTPRRTTAKAATTRRSPEELQQLILAVATEEFAEYGFSGARIDRMSKTAGTVDRMIYYYFDKKEGLYQAVLEHAYEEINLAMKSFEYELNDPLEGIRQLIRHNWDFHTERPQAIRLLMNENLLRGAYLKKSKKIRKIHHPLLSITEKLLEEGKAKRVIRQDAEVETTLLTILSMVFFYLSNQYTCSSWMSVNLMQKSRLNDWIEHICEVVTLSLAEPKQ
jgi:TetR/AcrR family transcriptional regulator, upper aerobic nicotinate degradation pathway regulator